jgi:hypothetical protein
VFKNTTVEEISSGKRRNFANLSMNVTQAVMMTAYLQRYNEQIKNQLKEVIRE